MHPLYHYPILSVESALAIDDSTTYKQVTVRYWNRGVVLRGEQKGVDIQTKRQFYVKTGQLLLSRIDVRNGAIGIVPKELDGAIISNDFWAYNFDENQIYPEFLALYIKIPRFIESANRASSGTTRRIRAEETALLNINIPLPSLTEQRRLVARIEALAARVAAAQSLRREASDETEAFLESAIGKFFSQINGTNPQPLKNLATKIGSGSTPKGGRETYASEGIPFIRSMNIRMRHFQYDDIAYIDETIHKSMSGTKVKPNDVLLNITGASIGRVACAPENLVEANVNQHVAIIRPIDKLDHKFLMYWLSQPEIQKYINDEQKGATRQGFTKFQIENLNVPVPPLEEQRRLVAYLDGLQAQVSALRAAQSATQKELDALMPSILDRAFKGEL